MATDDDDYDDDDDADDADDDDDAGSGDVLDEKQLKAQLESN